LLTIPLVAIPCMLKDRRMRFAFVTLAAIAVAMSACTWFLPHYFAPATALLYLLVVQGLRHMSLWKWPRSRSIASLLIMVACSVLVVRLIAIALHLPLESRWPRGNLERARISSMLDEQGGQQLVIVRYKDTHDPALEWVYNSASLENSKIVWARDMGRDRNAELLNHFSSRQALLLEPDTYPIVLKHYQP
jgi:hypothetical protein